jgi:putative DNA methylase
MNCLGVKGKEGNGDWTVSKKLIEVSLPLEVINRESAREKSIRHGHPSTLHLYWARRPLATARAVLFSQLVDDPSSNPDEFPTLEEQDAERMRLHTLLERLANWDNLNDKELFDEAKTEILKSNKGALPAILDPFAGGGAIPLEAQRLGLPSHASDLNPLSVLLNKTLIEFPPKFADSVPVYPLVSSNQNTWSKSEGLASDVRSYGQWMRDEAERRIGATYPKVRESDGTELTVISWIWARTVISPNPANPIETPLVRSWWLSKKSGHEAWIEAKVVNGQVEFEVRRDAVGPEIDGTIGRRGGIVVGDGTPMTLNYVREQGRAGLMGERLIAVVAEGEKGRIYLSPSEVQINAAKIPRPENIPAGDIPRNPRDFKTPNYGLTRWSDLFSNRQLTVLTTLCDLVEEVRAKVLTDAKAAGLDDGLSLEEGGSGAKAYADAVAVYLALPVSRLADYSSNVCTWNSAGEKMRNVFARQAIPMVWDFAEVNPFSSSSGNFRGQVEWVAKALQNTPSNNLGHVSQANAATRDYTGFVVSTDPPYYDNIGYADLSDFFYVWLRRSLINVLPKTLSTILTPKSDELVADPSRHGTKIAAEKFFVEGFNAVFSKIRAEANHSAPITIYYAYKQQEEDETGKSSTGWHTLLSGLIASGWEITATWPVRSELANRMIGNGTNVLASSIVLACRPRSETAEASTRRGFLNALKAELPNALRELMQGAIAPVDLAQAAIGPGIAVFSRYARVREADGRDMPVRDALLLINATLSEVLNEQESEFDPYTRFCVKWYKEFGWLEGSSGSADTLARASDTSIAALERGGAFEARAGKAKLFSPTTLSTTSNWDPATDDSLSIWECAVRLAGIMSREGAEAVTKLLPAVEARVGLDAVKELGFLLFHEAEKKGDTKDALLFNGLVGAWSDLAQEAKREKSKAPTGTQQAFIFEEDK